MAWLDIVCVIAGCYSSVFDYLHGWCRIFMDEWIGVIVNVRSCAIFWICFVASLMYMVLLLEMMNGHVRICFVLFCFVWMYHEHAWSCFTHARLEMLRLVWNWFMYLNMAHEMHMLWLKCLKITYWFWYLFCRKWMNARMIGLEETRDLGFREYINGELTLVN